jgi:hypothetical protein
MKLSRVYFIFIKKIFSSDGLFYVLKHIKSRDDNNYGFKKHHSTYTRVSNFGQNMNSKMTLRLIRGSTYTRVYTSGGELLEI